MEGAEKNTKYFSNMEKKRSEEWTIKQINIQNNIETDHANILNHVKDYYEGIFSEDLNLDNDDNSFLNSTEHKLNDAEKQSCDGIINEYECQLALKEMKHMKSPGSDGLTT